MGLAAMPQQYQLECEELWFVFCKNWNSKILSGKTDVVECIKLKFCEKKFELIEKPDEYFTIAFKASIHYFKMVYELVLKPGAIIGLQVYYD
jgi:hypothetical protein